MCYVRDERKKAWGVRVEDGWESSVGGAVPSRPRGGPNQGQGSTDSSRFHLQHKNPSIRWECSILWFTIVTLDRTNTLPRTRPYLSQSSILQMPSIHPPTRTHHRRHKCDFLRCATFHNVNCVHPEPAHSTHYYVRYRLKLGAVWKLTGVYQSSIAFWGQVGSGGGDGFHRKAQRN